MKLGSSKRIRFLVVMGILVAQLFLAGFTTRFAARAGFLSRAVVAEDTERPATSKLSQTLAAHLADGRETSFLVVMDEQADLSHVARLPTKEAKGRAVYDALRSVARRTQAPLRAELEARGVPYRSFYVVNMLEVRGDAQLAAALAGHREVARLVTNPTVRLSRPEDVGPATPPAPAPSHTSGASPAQDNTLVVEWGVERIGADSVWELGYTGQGIVVAGQDTGYEWDHPALISQYRGWNGSTIVHDYNWHDAIHTDDPHTLPGNPCGFDSPIPCDDNGHGTHTMGTVAGDGGEDNRIGVAPGARWIGCRNMEQGWGTPASYAECFEFFLAPYPIGGDPASDGEPSLAPHIINNSWSCPAAEGCDAGALRTIVENVRVAGIMVVVSAGNSGSSCGTVNQPPGLHDAVLTVGATDFNDQIAGFSSRGPVIADGSNRPKPDVSAPGEGVRSSVPGGGYGYKSGTSMAAPHVTGLVALLWSASPALIGDVERTEQLIRYTARAVPTTTCGGDADGHPNNVYGWGIVDALAGTHALSEGLQVSAEAEPAWVRAGDVITYTFTITNSGALTPATGVVLSDVLPYSTTFGWASGAFSVGADDVLWSLGTLSPTQQVSRTLAVTVNSGVPPGTLVVNNRYAVRSDQTLTPAQGAPAVSVVSWRRILPIFVRDVPFGVAHDVPFGAARGVP